MSYKVAHGRRWKGRQNGNCDDHWSCCCHTLGWMANHDHPPTPQCNGAAMDGETKDLSSRWEHTKWSIAKLPVLHLPVHFGRFVVNEWHKLGRISSKISLFTKKYSYCNVRQKLWLHMSGTKTSSICATSEESKACPERIMLPTERFWPALAASQCVASWKPAYWYG